MRLASLLPGLFLLASCQDCNDTVLHRGTARLEPVENPAALGVTLVGTPITRRVALRNSGDLAARLDGAQVVGEFFAVAGFTQGAIAPNTNAHVEVSFAPSRLGAFTATLQVTTQGQVLVVELQAAALAQCEDGNPCTLDRWDAALARCVQDARMGDCDDGSACTTGDQCLEGRCVGSAVSCDDGVTCTRDLCDPTQGCVHPPDPCEDDNPCTQDRCDNVLGCQHTTALDGEVCVAPQMPCHGAGQCSAGQCRTPLLPDGTPCTAANACVSGAQCVTGVCSGGTETPCEDDNRCTADACDGAGGCSHTPVSCEDSNPCTVNLCDPVAGCASVPAPDGMVCPGVNAACVVERRCIASVCTAVPAPDGTPCDDRQACTVEDVCQAGVCGAGDGVTLVDRWSSWGVGEARFVGDDRILIHRPGFLDVAVLDTTRVRLLQTLQVPNGTWLLTVQQAHGAVDMLLRDDATRRWLTYHLDPQPQLVAVGALEDVAGQWASAAAAAGDLLWECVSVAGAPSTSNLLRVRNLTSGETVAQLELPAGCSGIYLDVSHPRAMLDVHGLGLWVVGWQQPGVLQVQARLHAQHTITGVALSQDRLAIAYREEWLGRDAVDIHALDTLEARATVALDQRWGQLTWLADHTLLQSWGYQGVGWSCAWRVEDEAAPVALPCVRTGHFVASARNNVVVRSGHDRVARLARVTVAPSLAFVPLELEGALSLGSLEPTPGGLRSLSPDAVVDFAVDVQGHLQALDALPSPQGQMHLVTWPQDGVTTSRFINPTHNQWFSPTDALWLDARVAQLPRAVRLLDASAVQENSLWLQAPWFVVGMRAWRLVLDPPGGVMAIPYALDQVQDGAPWQVGQPVRLEATGQVSSLQLSVDGPNARGLLGLAQGNGTFALFVLGVDDAGNLVSTTATFPGNLQAVLAQDGTMLVNHVHPGQASLARLEAPAGQPLTLQPLGAPHPGQALASHDAVVLSTVGWQELQVSSRGVDGAWAHAVINVAGLGLWPDWALRLGPGLVALANNAQLVTVRLPCLP